MNLLCGSPQRHRAHQLLNKLHLWSETKITLVSIQGRLHPHIWPMAKNRIWSGVLFKQRGIRELLGCGKQRVVSSNVQWLFTDSTVNKTVFFIPSIKDVKLYVSHLRRCRTVDALAEEGINSVNKGIDTCL